MTRFRPFTQWLYADEPIYSFHSGIPLPPNLAVVMLKRLWSGDITNERIAAEIRAFKPGLILLVNDTRVVPFKDLIETEYQLVYLDLSTPPTASTLTNPSAKNPHSESTFSTKHALRYG
jgi:hypothetical protein